MKVRPMGKRMIVFTVPIRAKAEGSFLYQPRQSKGQFTGVEEVWVVEVGPECRGAYARGQLGFISDGFEYEPTDLSLWDELKDEPSFKKLKDFAQSVEGSVKTSLIHEDSLLAVED